MKAQPYAAVMNLVSVPEGVVAVVCGSLWGLCLCCVTPAAIAGWHLARHNESREHESAAGAS